MTKKTQQFIEAISSCSCCTSLHLSRALGMSIHAATDRLTSLRRRGIVRPTGELFYSGNRGRPFRVYELTPP